MTELAGRAFDIVVDYGIWGVMLGMAVCLLVGYGVSIDARGRRAQVTLVTASILIALITSLLVYRYQLARAREAQITAETAAVEFVASLGPESARQSWWFVAPDADRDITRFGRELATHTVGEFGAREVRGAKLDDIESWVTESVEDPENNRVAVVRLQGNYKPRTGSTRRTYLFSSRSFTLTVRLMNVEGRWLVQDVSCLEATDLDCRGLAACDCSSP